jgi:hypothetical protein
MPASSTEWFPVARSTEVGTTPPPGPAGPVLGNLDPALAHAWHPVTLSRALLPGGWVQVRLLGRTWSLRRTDDGPVADPPAFGVRERYGVVELAPAEPVDSPLDVPELADRRFVSGWLPPLRSPGAASSLLDALLDTAPGGGRAAGDLAATALAEERGGFTGVRETAGLRVTVAVRVPFRLRVRTADPVTGAVCTAVVLLQPEDADSTRVFTRVLLSAGPGRSLPAPPEVGRQVAEAHQWLSDGIRLMVDVAAPGLPLDLRDELHLPADRLGVALRRALCDVTFARQPHTAA